MKLIKFKDDAFEIRRGFLVYDFYNFRYHDWCSK